MKYTIELTDNQKKQMDLLCEIAHKHIGFNPKLEMVETTNVEDTNEYQIGYRVGYDMGLLKQRDPRFVPLQKCPVRLEDCKAYKLGLEDFEKLFIYEHDYEQFFEDTYGSKEPDYNLYDLVARYGAKKVVDDFKKWQEEKKKAEEEIKVGDEVQFGDESNGVVISIKDHYLRIVMQNGFAMSVLDYEVKKKTGKNFSAEVEQLLSKLEAN